MSNQGKSRKPLIIGIVAAVAVLAVLLALLLTQCVGGGEEATESTPVQTTVEEVPTYELYWNLDRAEYDGKSEAGMSSRQQESDGYFHIRFFKDGETVELRAADRKVINAIDFNDIMGLEFDQNGIIIGVISIDDMPLEQVGWQFYVQSYGGKLLKLNSSKSYNGLEVLLDIHDFTGIWDMTGLEGPVGTSIKPISGDRVIAIANLAGELTHVYVYDRPEYMRTFKGHCQHCNEEVEWKMWTKENALPVTNGHYQLQNNISGMSAQQAVQEDQKVCLDLNGMQVDGKDNARVYTLHHPGAHLAIMDTSEGQKGVLKGHSTSSDQGGVVWVRYGQFHLYAGTLDASDMISDMNGAAIDVPKGSFFYMYGGKIIGGNAKAVKNDKGAWTNGLGGTVVVRGKFVFNDGIIEGGKATGVITKYAADGTPSTYSRGIGGNIYVGSGGVFEMNGGTIRNGTATHSGGNVYVDGTGEFTMNGGTIFGGKVTGKGRNGGNVFITSKSTFDFNGGSIINGKSYNCAANLYLNGKVTMRGGHIGGGVIYDWATKEVSPTSNSANVFNVNGQFIMYGGSIDGSFQATDTAVDKTKTLVLVSGYATIMGPEDDACDDLVLGNGGDGITVRVGTLYDRARIGVNATTGIFTLPAAEHNVDNFFSNIDDADICYVDGCIALGRFSCLCGNNEKGGHYGQCDGTKLFWGPMTSTTLPTKTGNYYLPRVEDANGNLVPRTLEAKQQASLAENADVKIDLNGGTLVGPKDFRVISVHNPGAKVTVTDSSEGKTGVMKSHGQGNTQGNVVWTRYGSFDFYGGTLDGSEYVLHTNWNAGTDGIFGTADDKDDARDGGTVSMSTGTTINMYGGTIIGNTTKAVTLTKTIKETSTEIQIVEGEETEVTVEVEKEVTRTVASANGASVSVGNKSVFNLYAGTVRDGISGNTGGNFLISSTGVVNLYGGTISGGQAGPVYAADGTTVVTKGWGGNFEINGSATLNILSDDVLITAGKAGGNGGNIRVSSGSATLNMQAGTISDGESTTDQGGNMFLSGTVNLSGGIVTGGKAKNGGNIGINSGKDILLDGVTVSNGVATQAGGNIGVSTTSKAGVTTIAAGTVITGGQAANGGNVALQTNNANKTNPVATMVITGGTIEKGTATTAGANVYVKGQPDCSASLTISGGTITGGKTPASGGGIYAEGTSTLTMDGGLVTDNVARWGGSIYLSSGTSMTLNKGTITNGSTYDNGSGSSGNGGNIYTTSAVITMNGGTISNGKTGDFGGNVWTQGTFTMNGGLITGGEATASTSKGGGNLYTNNANGKFYLNGGTVENGVAAKGGNIMLNNAGAICVIDGATVTGGQTTSSHGGNVNVALGTLTLKSGTISNGVSKDTAGNIYNNGGTVIIEGGKVLGGVDKNGANADESSIYIVSAAIELRGGELDGGVFVYNYKNENGSVKMSGNPVIKSDTRNGLRVHYSDGATKIPVIQIDQPMTDGAEVYITCTNWDIGKFTTATEESYAKYFHPDDETRSIGFVDNCVALGKTYCLCGSKTETHKLGCDGKQLFWMPMASTGSLPTASGNYYIHPSVTVKLSAQWKPAADAKINLDLNGRTITCNARVFAITNANSVVTVTDTASGGKIFKDDTVTDTANDTGMYGGQGGIVWVSGGSTFNLIEGIIDGTGYINSYNGAGICVEGTNSRFNMYGGTVKGTNSVSNGGNVAVKGTNTEMHMYGGSIEGGLTQSTGGNLYITGTAKVYLHGGTITGGRAGKDYAGGTSNGWGANVEVAGTGYLKIEEGVTISDGRCLGNGGNIRIAADSVVEMTGGLITGGQTNDNGGNIMVQGTLNVTGGAIEGGRAKNGGNISANTSKTVSLSNITISGGEATTGQGGNVRIFNNADATLNLTNVTLTGGSDPKKTTENLDVTVGATVNITDSKIDGGASIVDPGATITLSGKVEITGAETNLSLGGAMLNLVDFSEESLIGINYAKGGVFTTATEEKFKDSFTSDDPDMSVDFVDGKMVLALGKYYCLCGSTTDTHALGCDGIEHFWLPWNSSTTLPAESGYWYLTQDVVTLSEQVKITTAQNIYLDLNGKTVKNGEGKNIRFYWISADDCHVTVTDTVGGGNMTNNGQYTQGMIAWVSISGATKAPSFTLINGTLDVSAATAGNHSVAPNAICLASASCTFNMYGGQVKGGNTANGGGAIYGENWDSRVNIYGGTVTGHPEEQHPAVRLYGTKNVFSGGTITGGVEINSYRFDTETTKSTSQLTLSGNVNIDSIVITDINETRTTSGNFTVLPLITINGKLPGSTSKLSVLGDAVHVFTANTVDATNASRFVAATSGQSVLAIEEGTDAGKLYIGKTRCICGATDGNHTTYTDPDGNTVGCDGKAKPFMPWTSTSSLPTATGYWYLTKDVNYTGQAALGKDAKVVLDLNGKTVKPAQNNGVDINARVYSVHNEGAHLTITDTVGTGKMIASSVRSDQGNVLWVRNATAEFDQTKIGSIVLMGGTLQGANPKNGGAGEVVNIDAKGKFYMLGGTIQGGTTTGNGGNISLDGNATMYMAGGTVTGGKALRLSDGTTNPYGGNIYVSNNATLYVTGGTISNGIASLVDADGNISTTAKAGWGGNIYATGADSEVTLKNATVTGGISGGNGGSINAAGTLYVENTTISGGESKLDRGGNVWLGAANFTFISGRIENGKAGGDRGGNVHANANATLSISGGTITGGTVKGSASNASANINWEGGTGKVTIGGTAKIDGYVYIRNASTVIEISGKPVISGGSTNLTPVANITVGTLEAGAKIGINRDPGVFTTNTVNEAYAAYFTADKTNTAVAWNNGGDNAGKLSIGNVYAVCGMTTKHAAHDYCDGELHTWLVTASLPVTTGHWYLASQMDITAINQTKTVKTEEQIVLDLNGQDIVSKISGSGAGRLYSFLNGTVYDTPISLMLTSTKSGSAIIFDDKAVDGNTVGDQGRLCWVVGINKKVTFNNIEVDMTNMETKQTSMNGQLICDAQANHGTNDNKNIVSFYDVTIKGCEVAGSMMQITNNTDVLLHNTTITGHKSTTTDFGAVAVYGGSATYPSKLILSGDTSVSGNSSQKGNANIYLGSNGYLELTESYKGSTSKPQGIDCNNSRVLLTDVEYGTFVADLDTKQVAFAADGMKVVTAAEHVHCACSGTVKSGTKLANGETHTCVDIIYSEMTSTGGKLTANAAWYVPAGETVTLTSTIDQDQYDLDLCLNGGSVTIAGGKTAITAKTRKLTITSCDSAYVDGETTKNVISGSGSSTTDYGVISVGTGGRLDFFRGTINGKDREAYNAKHGGAVANRGGNAVQYPNTTIIGATVRSNDTTNANANRAHGGSVYLNSSATYHMLGGTIRDGITYQNGGNVYVMTGTFYMYDGQIIDGWHYTGNADPNNSSKTIDSSGVQKKTQSNANSNVTVRENGKFIMSGGWVKGSVSGSNISTNTDTAKYPYIELSGSAKIYRSAGSLTGNNLWISGTTNIVIKDLNEDAAIGFMYTGTSGAPSYKCAAYTGENTLNLEQLGIYMYGLKDSGRTFELTLDSKNEVRVVETTE